jgi:DNA-binding HxlR family transcriptional regulator
VGSSTSELAWPIRVGQNPCVPSRDEYCPVAKAADTVGDRWSLLLIREMLRGVGRFNELERSVPGISRSVLAQRLRQLERTGVVARRSGPRDGATEYRLTDAGREAEGVVQALNDWGVRWLLPHPRSRDVDPDGLMMWIRRHVVLDALPSRRVVIEFELRRSRQRKHYWLVLRPGEVSLCPEHPGFPEDLRIVAEVAALYRVFVGSNRLAEAVDGGQIQLEGPPSLVRAIPAWFRIR